MSVAGGLPFANHHIVRMTEFGGVKVGDRVKVTDGQHEGEFFDFLSHNTNIETGAQWVELWGGKRKHEQLIAVRDHLIEKVDK